MSWLFDYMQWYIENNPIYTNPIARKAYLKAIAFATNNVQGMERDEKRVAIFFSFLNEEYHRQLAILLDEEAKKDDRQATDPTN